MRLKIYYILSLIFAQCVFSQEKDTVKVVSSSGLNMAAGKLSKTLNKKSTDQEIAKEYENVANELIHKKEYKKAEEYLNKAKKLYSKNKQKKKVASVSRDLAKVQESQNRYKDAIENYDVASQNAAHPNLQAINNNDASRLRNNSNLGMQKNLIQQNIRLSDGLEKNDASKEEKSMAYQQLAAVDLRSEDKKKALINLNSALENSKSKKDETDIKRQIAEVYVASNQIDKAIDVNKKLAEDARKSKDTQTEIEQLQILSKLYLEQNNEKEGAEFLKKAYDLAIKEGRTMDAKKSLEQLTNLYEKEGSYTKSILLYQDFLGNLDVLIQSDSSLVDAKIFEISEGKINRLEKEKLLQDELIKKQNFINYILIILLVIVIVSVVFIVKTLYEIKKKNKRIELQSLRREMNPHFIFNSLNSVNQFIAQNNELEANKYLTSYSKLMRNVMENSNKDFIKLSQEIDQLTEYLDLELLRFSDKFEYKITVDSSLDSDAVFVPNMLIQPNLENAIWHGLRYKDQKGLLELSVFQEENRIIINIEDNGIGLEQSQKIKTKNQKLHKSRGLTNSRERITLLNDLYKTNITFDLTEKKSETGAIVSISLPIINSNKI